MRLQGEQLWWCWVWRGWSREEVVGCESACACADEEPSARRRRRRRNPRRTKTQLVAGEQDDSAGGVAAALALGGSQKRLDVGARRDRGLSFFFSSSSRCCRPLGHCALRTRTIDQRVLLMHGLAGGGQERARGRGEEEKRERVTGEEGLLNSPRRGARAGHGHGFSG
jgi:hypothetical protein